MSQAVKEKSLPKLDQENESDEISEEISTSLQLDDFVWVENWVENESSEVISNDNFLENSGETDADIIYVAQYNTNTENSDNAEESLLECNADVAYSGTASEWERGLIVEQNYWEQYGSVVKNESSYKPKSPTSQRLTIKDYNKINHDKRSNRDPCHYKFDYPTTVVLKTLLEQRHAGPYHNVVSNGMNSVVIYAEYPKGPYVRGAFRMDSYYGVAVKVYKLSNDVDRNDAIFKRVQREYTNLVTLKHTGYIPLVVHAMKNVIITQFIGEDQETAPSISIVPSGYCRDMYQLIIKEMDKWYKKKNLVHGNLGTKSIVVNRYKDGYYGVRYIPYFLGWSHSVKTNHPHALVKLYRDCQFVTNFFKKREVSVKCTEELFKDITGLEEISSKVLEAMQKKDLWQERHLKNPNRENQARNSQINRT